MRRNPRPYKSVDRRKLAMDIIEREARSQASPQAIEAARDRELTRRLTSSPLSLKPRKS